MSEREIAFDAAPWIGLLIRTLVLVMFSYCLVMASRRRRSAPHIAARYQALLGILCIWIVVLALWLGGIAQVWPPFLDVARAFGLIASGATLLSGLALAATYWRGEETIR